MATTAANVIVAGGTLSIAGADVGFTQGGISLRVPRDYRDVEADQIKSLVKKVAILTRAFVRTTLLEPTLVNLQRAWDQSGTGSIAVGASSEVAIVVTGTGPSSATRTVTFSRCISSGEGEYGITRDQENTVEVEFEALTTSEQFGTIVDV